MTSLQHLHLHWKHSEHKEIHGDCLQCFLGVDTNAIDLKLIFEKILPAASNALRSYQYGNSAPDLAKEVADEIDKILKPRREATLR